MYIPERSDYRWRWLTLLLAVIWLFAGITGHQPWKPDEAYSFGLILELLQGGDWVVPHLAGEPFLEKPPLYYLTAALFARLFGHWLPLHDAARLATSFYLMVALAALWGAGRRLWGERQGFYAVLFAIGALGGLIRLHQGITDVALFAGMAVALYGFVLSLEQPLGGGLLLGMGAGMAFLSKGLLGPGMLAVLALVLPLVSGVWRTPAYGKALLTALLAASPWLLIWPLLLYQRSPELFHIWFWDNNIGRFLGNRLGPKGSPTLYLRILPWYGLPAWPIALWMAWRNRDSLLRRPALTLPLIAFFSWLLILSASAQGRELYALPLLLPLSLLAAGGLEQLSQSAARLWRWSALVLFGLSALGIVYLWLISVTGWTQGLPHGLGRYATAISQPVRLWAVVAALTVLVGWLWLLMRAGRGGVDALLSWVGGLVAVWLLTILLLLPVIDRIKGYDQVIGEMSRWLNPQAGCVAASHLGEPQRAMIHYYLGFRVRRLEVDSQAASCPWLLVQTDGKEPAGRAGGRSCSFIWSGSRPSDRKERFEPYRCR